MPFPASASAECFSSSVIWWFMLRLPFISGQVSTVRGWLNQLLPPVVYGGRLTYVHYDACTTARKIPGQSFFLEPSSRDNPHAPTKDILSLPVTPPSVQLVMNQSLTIVRRSTGT